MNILDKLVILLPFLIAFIFYLLIFFSFIKIKIGRPIKCYCKVIDKYYTLQDSVNNFRLPQYKSIYIVAFACGDKTLKLEVPPWLYSTFDKGETGILTYKNLKFVNFDADNENKL